mmetsp:Transcript_137995/g.275096  ORF Transcript_137995/g.275096 Transcript_137995/m.275096 type:complete len:418 (-) Transcript_137995:342-1595(-)
MRAMVERVVTAELYRDEVCKPGPCSLCGFIIFAICALRLVINENSTVHQHMLSGQALEEGIDVACDEPAKAAPSKGLVYLSGCHANVTGETTTSAFADFQEVLRQNESHHVRAWVKLRIQHFTRRRRNGWRDVTSDGQLTERTIINNVRLGPYVLEDDLVLKIPGQRIQLVAASWQKQGISPPETQPLYGGWIFNSKTMTYEEDCNCIWAGDTRVFFEAAAPISTMSALGGPSQGLDFKRLGAWESETQVGFNIGLIDPGVVNREEVLVHHLQRVDSRLWMERLGCGLGFFCGMWVFLWPWEAYAVFASADVVACCASCDCCCGGLPCVILVCCSIPPVRSSALRALLITTILVPAICSGAWWGTKSSAWCMAIPAIIIVGPAIAIAGLAWGIQACQKRADEHESSDESNEEIRTPL